MQENNIFVQDFWVDGDGIQKMREFFENFCKEFAEFSINYHNKLGEFPFTYAERSLTSVVMPSLMKADSENTFVFMEQPFNKSSGEQRFLDFYVDHDSNLYLIEMKHGWDAYRTLKQTKRIRDRWEDVIGQIKDITLAVVEENLCSSDSYQNMFKVALLIMPVYLEYKEGEHIRSLKEQYEQICGYFNDSEEDELSDNYMIGLWKIDNHEKYAYEYDGGKQVFPYVAFIIYQEKI